VNHGPVYIKDGKKYGVVSGNFTDHWFDYYERGLSYKDGEYYQDALSDIDTAIKIKPHDQRWINTYGMHFIDYFPHREKGIIYFFLGEYTLSEDELILSMHHAPSAKAGYFLDQVRIKRMLLEKKEISAPEISLVYPKRTNEEYAEITGFVMDECYVSAIFAAGGQNLIESSGKHIPFKKTVYLPEGKNDLDIMAKNLMGGQTKKTIQIEIDRSGPTIVITHFVPGLKITGYVTDQSEVTSFKVNQTEKVDTLERGSFSVVINSDFEPVVLAASDDLGNKTELALVQDKTTHILCPLYDVLLASNSLSATDSPSGLMNPHPQVQIVLNHITDECIVYKRNINLKGEIRSPSKIKKIDLLIDGRNVGNALSEGNKSVHISGHVISFNKSISVKEGENRFAISAEDISGNVYTKEITILRKIPEILKLENRFAIKIYPLDERVKKYKSDLINWLFGKTPVFSGYSRFMDQSSSDIFRKSIEQEILSRKRFQLVSLDQIDLLKTARSDDRLLLGPTGNQTRAALPDALLIGNSCVDKNGTDVTVRLIDLSSFEEIISKDVFCTGNEIDDLKMMAVQLSEKLHMALPVVKGCIDRISGRTIRVSFDNGRIAEGWPLFVYSDQNGLNDIDTCISKECHPNIKGIFKMGCDKTIDMGKSSAHVETGDKVINK